MSKWMKILGVVSVSVIVIAFFQNCSVGSWSSATNGSSQAGEAGYMQTAPRGIYIFGTLEKFNGNLGGRAGADQKCQQALADFKSQGHPFNCSALNTHAVIGINEQDRILDMKQNFKIPEIPMYVVYRPMPNFDFAIHEMQPGLNYSWAEMVGNTSGDGGIFTISPDHFFVGEDATGYWMGVKGDTAVTGTPAETCNGFTYDKGFPTEVSGGDCVDGHDLRCAQGLICSTADECSTVRGDKWQQCNQEAHLMCACW